MVGPTARAYVLWLESATDTTVDVVSFHPTATTFKSLAVCTDVNTTLTLAWVVRGVAEFDWTNVIVGAAAKLAGSSAAAARAMLIAIAAEDSNTEWLPCESLCTLGGG
jgi:hypothetical protein